MLELRLPSSWPFTCFQFLFSYQVPPSIVKPPNHPSLIMHFTSSLCFQLSHPHSSQHFTSEHFTSRLFTSIHHFIEPGRCPTRTTPPPLWRGLEKKRPTSTSSHLHGRYLVSGQHNISNSIAFIMRVTGHWLYCCTNSVYLFFF